MTDAIIAKLEEKGFNRWTKGRFDRLYVNASTLGLSCTYHRTGSEASAEFNGVSVSNSEARRMKGTKCYIDVATGEVVCDNDMMRDAAEAILAECGEPEAETEMETGTEKSEMEARIEASQREAVAESISRDVKEVKAQATAQNVPVAAVEKTMRRITLIRDYFASCPIADLRTIIGGSDLNKVCSTASAIKRAMSSVKGNLVDVAKFDKLVKELVS